MNTNNEINGEFDTDLSIWDVSKVTNFDFMFQNDNLGKTNGMKIKVWKVKCDNAKINGIFGNTPFQKQNESISHNYNLIDGCEWFDDDDDDEDNDQ